MALIALDIALATRVCSNKWEIRLDQVIICAYERFLYAHFVLDAINHVTVIYADYAALGL